MDGVDESGPSEAKKARRDCKFKIEWKSLRMSASSRGSTFCDICKEFTSIKDLKILKHVSTRWLSLEKVCKRILNQWDAYFDKESEDDSLGLELFVLTVQAIGESV